MAIKNDCDTTNDVRGGNMEIQVMILPKEHTFVSFDPSRRIIHLLYTPSSGGGGGSKATSPPR